MVINRWISAAAHGGESPKLPNATRFKPFEEPSEQGHLSLVQELFKSCHFVFRSILLIWGYGSAAVRSAACM